MNKHSDNKVYKTSSLPIACSLSAKYSLLDIDRTDPKRAVFIFKYSTDLERMVKDYWEGSLKVEPQSYFNNLRVLKGRLYSEE